VKINPFKDVLARLAGLALGVAVAVAPLDARPALADGGAPEDSASRTIVVVKDKSAAFRLDYPISEIVVAQPDMLQLVATTDHSFYLRGKALGVTNLLVYDSAHHLAQVIDVRVGLDTESLQADLAIALPGEHITASNFAGGILLSGTASSTGVADRAAAIAEHYAPKGVSSTVNVTNSQQIMVEVRFIEASRNALKDMGFNMSASNGNGTISLTTGTGLASSQTPQGTLNLGGKFGSVSANMTIEALEQRGIVRTLAKPNLMAMSGEEASFLAGGEFPYPVPNGLTGLTVEFRQYGVKLNVTPTLEDDGQIRLKVAPEVSQLDTTHTVTINGYNMPGLTESNASTTVELRDGQSFAIAGLFQQNYTNALNQLPGLGNVPVLGALFRSADFQRQQTELVIIVTPRLMSPTNHIETLPNPLMDSAEPSAIDLILSGITDKAALAAHDKP
jgi:pilus assembly protein CpaC